MIRSFLKGGVFYKTPQLHANAAISKDSDIVNKWYVDTKVNNTQIDTKQYVDTKVSNSQTTAKQYTDSTVSSTRQYVDSRVASIPIVDESLFVKKSGNQTINGTQYFNYSPTVPDPTAGSHAANKAYVDNRVAINERLFVKISGDQTINDTKSFNSSPVVPTPTADTQAVNKQYVDNMVIISQNGSNSYAVAMAIVFGS